MADISGHPLGIMEQAASKLTYERGIVGYDPKRIREPTGHTMELEARESGIVAVNIVPYGMSLLRRDNRRDFWNVGEAYLGVNGEEILLTAREHTHPIPPWAVSPAMELVREDLERITHKGMLRVVSRLLQRKESTDPDEFHNYWHNLSPF